MPRAFLTAVIASAALLASGAPTQAAPHLRLSVHTEPIPEFPHTGNIAGAGVSIATQIGIEGSEYGGHPPPLIGLSLRLPLGMHWNASGFPTCPRSILEPQLGPPIPCPRGSEIQTGGSDATLDVAFGTEVVTEKSTVMSSYAARGGFTLKLFGHEPVLIELLARGIARQNDSSKGELLSIEMPLTETVPGEADASFTSIGFRLGSGFQPDPKTPRFSLYEPRRCPHGYLRFSVEASFAALGGLPAQTATASYRAPCPRRAQHPR
jgi:hypothetical protein